jgi:type IV pilus assembly protein PilQ
MISASVKGKVGWCIILMMWSAIPLWGSGTLTDITIKPVGDATEVVIRGTDLLKYNDFSLSSPPRVVIDLLDTWNHLSRKTYSNLNRGGVLSIRTSQYKDDVSRVVLDVSKEVIYSIIPGEGELKVVFRNPEESFTDWETKRVNSSPEVVEEAPSETAPVQAEADGKATEMAGTETKIDEPGAAKEDRITETAEEERITVDFHDADIRAVIRAFSEFSGLSIVAGREVKGKVTAKITDMPWRRAFTVLMKANGFGVEVQDGIYRVDRLEVLRNEENLAMLEPTVFQLNYINAVDIVPTVESMLSERGRVQTDIKTNSIIVSDIPERLGLVENIIPQLDIQTEQVTIKSKLLFVNSVDLQQLGINWMATNTIDPTTDTHGEVITGQAVSDPFLSLTFGTFKSGTNVTGILEALQEKQMVDVQAQPQITTLDNLEAEVFVGEKTPIRVLDIGAETQAAASIELIETGIKLVVTPHITNDDKIIMELKAERSSAVPVPTEFGVEFQTQEGRTTLLVEDGQTAVIGGLTTMDTIKTRRGIPLISDIPLIGNLFKFSSDRVEKKDLLILVTPYIVS